MDTKIELCRLYENTSKAGKPYFIGYLGKAKVLMLKDEKAAEGQPPWVLFLCERPDKRADADQQPARDHRSPPYQHDRGRGAVAASGAP